MKNPLKFIQDVKQEAFKVTWPTGKETIYKPGFISGYINSFMLNSLNL